MNTGTDTSAAFMRLVGIMNDLREKCPWDKKQTIHTLRNLTIEETYELADAIMDSDYEGIKEEIGDVMLHLVFYARIAAEQNEFTLSEAIQGVCEKLIHRHPHVYGDIVVADDQEVKQNWEKLKLTETKSSKGLAGQHKKSVLGGVPISLPAMVKAYRMQEKTKQVGFEWEHADQVWDKVEEEIEELKSSLQDPDNQDHIEEEFGDVLFALINYGRFIGVEAETALERVNKKFKFRFEYIEQQATKPLSDMTLDEMNMLWNQAKKLNFE
ncbi:MAG: nucleoside triphosphate pyrophosphohydrolase [Saprospiraceae bacterium]|nr:nucleoside triphosphate pyrophosphohydrolase [Saprospiraceae bacterium]MBK8777501.1 nucleoside triphosphate pyrophosphohydrolase [Saprospiraceae bacterium]MBL0113726.1 nucleoside triphosphate pyrophosphohydrolase [Saprospiraceae bacterium]